jgi:ribose 5-phosphate isomerase B
MITLAIDDIIPTMEIILAADHGGYASKENIKGWLEEQGHQVLDAGALAPDPDDDFPDFAAQAIKLWHANHQRKLILWCRSGVGMVIAANRIKGIYAGMALSPEQLQAATRDDHLNALAIAIDFQDLHQQKQLIEVFLQTPATDAPRFRRRLRKLDQLKSGA